MPAYATLPRTFLTTTVASTPSPGATLRCGPGKPFTTFQAAYDAANLGDTILLSPGAIFSENDSLAGKSGSNWITVKTDLDSFIPEGQRITPTDAATYNLARIRSPNNIQSLSALADSGFVRFIGVEFDVDPARCIIGTETSQGIVRIGDGSVAQNDLAHVPTDWIFDRCYFHGTQDQDIRKAISGDGARVSCVDSYFDLIRSAFDAQCFAVTNGPGPFKLLNCYFASSGENVAFGGATPGINGLVPSDIEIRNCHFDKPAVWQSDARFNYKNLIESKNSKYALVTGCKFSGSWRAGQQGFAFVLWTADQQKNANWTETSHWTIEYCDISRCIQAFQFTAKWPGDVGSPAGGVPMHHITVRHCLGRGIGDPNIGSYYQISDDIAQLVFEHNTGFSSCGLWLYWGGAKPLTDHVVRYNIGGAWNALLRAGGTSGAASWTEEAGPGSELTGNVIYNGSGPDPQVAGNAYPASSAAIKFAGGDVAFATDTQIEDFRLAADSPYKGTADAGSDPGVDIDELLSRLAGDDTPPVETPRLSSITLTPSSVGVNVGQSTNLTAAGFDQFGAPFALGTLGITFSTPGIASAAADGTSITITGIAQGSTAVRVTSSGVQSNLVSVAVSSGAVPVPVLTTIVLGPNAITGTRNGTANISVAAFDQLGGPMALPDMTFHSTNAAVAEIDRLAGNQLKLAMNQAGICSVWVESGVVVSNRVTAFVNDPSGGKGHHRP